MTINIAFFHATDELRLMKDFLDWQQCPFKFDLPSSLCMVPSGGKGTPCVYLDEKLVAIGFFALVDWLRKEGRVLL